MENVYIINHSGNIRLYFRNNKKLIGRIDVFNYKDQADLYNFYVHEEYRNKGYGKHILNYVFKNYKKKIWLFVDLGNNKALKLYNKLGFRLSLTTQYPFKKQDLFSKKLTRYRQIEMIKDNTEG
jgi:ribosomal protein S18 acetylase RimI-like enzyme